MQQHHAPPRPATRHHIAVVAAPPSHMQPPPHRMPVQQAAAGSAPPPPPPHMRDHHSNRFTHHHQQQQHHQQPLPPQQQQALQHHHHQTTQMQKIRQQHQHLNNNKGPYQQAHYNVMAAPQLPHQQQQSQAAPRNGSNGGGGPPPGLYGHPQQQHSHIMPPQQAPPAMHMKQQHRAPNLVMANSNNSNNHMMKAHQQQQMATNVAMQQQQHSYYLPGNNHNNNNTNHNSKVKYQLNYGGPKVILQNPKRQIKPRPPLAPTAAAAAPTTAPVATTTTAAASEVGVTVSAATPVEVQQQKTSKIALNLENAVVPPETIECTSESAATVDNGDGAEVEDSTSTAASSHSDSNTIIKNTILPNEDSSVLAKNSKEKTPMCLVNELARYNKIAHQYRLTSEMGPAHCKRFTVTLKLGEEEYSAEGFKIKKAQHLAAGEAVEKTKYKHPVPKVTRRADDGSGIRPNITPTVELNALAMKLGQQTYYLFDPRQMPSNDCDLTVSPDGMVPAPATTMSPTHMMPPPSTGPPFNRRSIYMSPHISRYGPRGFPPKFPRYPTPSTPCKITLIVGKQKFTGIGRTLQQAKHDAAARALLIMKAQATSQLNDMLNQSLEEADSKSPISLVHEIGIKRSLTVQFKVLWEEGPAHMKNFTTACIVGTIVTEGKGHGKKISKRRAAEQMLEELKKLPPLTPTKSPVKRIKVKTSGKGHGPTAAVTSGDAAAAPPPPAVNGKERAERRGKALKERPSADDDAENPITKLIQLQQNRKEKEPVYELIAKNGNEYVRRREFIMEVTAQGMVARGTGSSKKLAKRNASQKLLMAMEQEHNISTDIRAAPAASPQPADAVATTTTAANPAENNNNALCTDAYDAGTPAAAESAATTPAAEPSAAVTMEVPLVSTTAGQVPGILILRQNKKLKKKELAAAIPPKPSSVADTTGATTSEILVAAVTTPAPADVVDSKESTEAASEPASKKSNSPPPPAADTSSKSATPSTAASSGVNMKDQLLYLAKLLGFEVNFSDYPKGNHNEFLTIVTLSTNPPQICHGVGVSSDESQNDAARNALKILSELGLNSATK